MTWFGIVLTIEVVFDFQLRCHLYDLIANTFEFFVFFKRNLLGHRISVGSECFASALMPQVIQLIDFFVSCYHFDNLIHQFLGFFIKISVNLFAFMLFDSLRKHLEFQSNFRIVVD